MRVSRMVACWGLAVTCVACSAVPHDPQEDQKDSDKPILGESDKSGLFPALRQFVLAPGTKPDRVFVGVEKATDGSVRFTKVPDGWFTWKDGSPEGRVIGLDRDGFRILITLNHIPDVEQALIHNQNASIVLLDHLFAPDGQQITRVVNCGEFKGSTNFTECRYYDTRPGAICVELTIIDDAIHNRTFKHLRAPLSSHYGKYEGVCDQVAEIVSAMR